MAAIAFISLAVIAPARGSISSFSDGRAFTDFYGRGDIAHATAMQGRRVLMAGHAKPRAVDARAAVSRLTPRGRLDRSFGRRGRVVLERWTTCCGRRGGVRAVHPMPKGRLLLAGGGLHMTAALLRADGVPVGRFGTGGIRKLRAVPGIATAEDAARLPNGKLLLAGHSHAADGSFEVLVLARLHRDGRLDRQFGTGGTVMTAFGEDLSARAYALAAQPDGKLVVAGEVESNWFVARFRPDGSPDPSFGGGDGFQPSGPILTGSAFDVALQPNGRILAAGQNLDGPGSAFGLARYLPNGTADPSFGGGDGAVRTVFIPNEGEPQDVAVDVGRSRDGRILVGGTASLGFRGGPPSRFALAIYLRNGRLDRGTFGDGMVMRHPRDPRYGSEANALAIRRRHATLVGESFRRSSHEDFTAVRFQLSD